MSHLHHDRQKVESFLTERKGITVSRLLAGISPLLELDNYGVVPVIMMEVVKGDTFDASVESDFRKSLKYDGEIEKLERFAFYERSKKAFAIVSTGETRKYGNIILKKGVTPIAEEI